jgi:hypothetical protein
MPQSARHEWATPAFWVSGPPAHSCPSCDTPERFIKPLLVPVQKADPISLFINLGEDSFSAGLVFSPYFPFGWARNN